MGVVEELHELRERALTDISSAQDTSALSDVRVAYLGKKGSLTGVLRGLGSLSAQERPTVGKTSNEVRRALEAALDSRKSELEATELQERMDAGALDVTLPGRRRAQGHQHLIQRITREIVEVFVGLGYTVAEGPEVEMEYYNFTALNHTPHHPARSASDGIRTTISARR
jgi:phenylalanyl-tRNA synthetase alpha chain